MGNRTAKFVSALVASVLAGAPLAAVSQDAPSPPKAAADDCLASPKGSASEGQHWYYRIERGTKRQCWYLRAEGAKATQQTTQQSARAATPAPATQTPAHNVQDARAEWTAPNTTASIPTPNAATTAQRPNDAADDSSQPPAVAARWPDALATSPAPQPAQTTVADTAPAPAAASPSTAPLAAASVPAAKPTGSLQTLLLVVVGALALAGITGSLIYRFAGSRRRAKAKDGARRRVNWDNWEHELEEARAPWVERAKPAPARLQTVERPRPSDFGFAMAQAAKPAARTSKHDLFKQDLFKQDLLEAAGETRSEAEPMQPDEALIAFGTDEPEAAAEIGTPATATDAEAEMDADAVDIDAITAILERLAKEGPKLGQPGPTTGSAAFAQSRQGRSDVRA